MEFASQNDHKGSFTKAHLTFTDKAKPFPHLHHSELVCAGVYNSILLCVRLYLRVSGEDQVRCGSRQKYLLERSGYLGSLWSDNPCDRASHVCSFILRVDHEKKDILFHPWRSFSLCNRSGPGLFSCWFARLLVSVLRSRLSSVESWDLNKQMALCMIVGDMQSKSDRLPTTTDKKRESLFFSLLSFPSISIMQDKRRWSRKFSSSLSTSPFPLYLNSSI